VTIVRVALPVAVDQPFDYWLPAGLAVHAGHVVRVRLGARRLAGVVLAVDDRSDVAAERMRSIDAVADVDPLPDDVLALCRFVASYYQAAIGLVHALAVPPLARGPARERTVAGAVGLTPAGCTALPALVARAPAARALFERLRDAGELDAGAIAALSPHARRTLRSWIAAGQATTASAARPVGAAQAGRNDAQRVASAAIDGARGGYVPFLLQGVTGSGKTEVYLDAAARAIAAGGQVLMLVPEIGLTPALEARVRAALPGVRVATLHSGLGDGARRRNFDAAACGDARLVLGTRLAVFTPLPDLALVVVDEEHDGSFKQQDGVRYHARDVAVWRAHARGVPIVLGSATPSLETFANARDGRYRRLVLAHRADPRARLPTIVLVPDRDARFADGIGPALRDALARGLARGEQGLVFINRRGFAPSLKCASCGWDAQCVRCSARLVLHRHPPGLACHHCGHRERVPPACPSCGNVDLLPQGFGTQRLERHLRALFPAARIARIDRDTTRAIGSFDAVRQRMHDRELDLLVGTQMLAKGHDFPRLTTVGVLGADNALYSADFRATERLCALLMQVAGRAGRAEHPGEVIVQTDFPDHPVYAALRAHDYDAFAARLLEERAAAGLPPVTHVALLTGEAHDRLDVERFLDAAHDAARQAAQDTGVTVYPPVPALMARRAGLERAQMLVQAARRAELSQMLPAWHAALRQLRGRKVRWAIDVDPAGF